MDPLKKRIRRVRRLAEAAVPLKHSWEVPGPGRGKKLPPTQKVQSGNRRVYLVNRIARDRPDVLERMKTGEFETVRQAARAAGILPEIGGERQGRQLRKPAIAAIMATEPPGSSRRVCQRHARPLGYRDKTDDNS